MVVFITAVSRAPAATCAQCPCGVTARHGAPPHLVSTYLVSPYLVSLYLLSLNLDTWVHQVQGHQVQVHQVQGSCHLMTTQDLRSDRRTRDTPWCSNYRARVLQCHRTIEP